MTSAGFYSGRLTRTNTGTALVVSLFACCLAVGAHAEIAEQKVRIGVLTDMSGFGADNSGKGSLVAAQLAAQDSASLFPTAKIEVVGVDHQNKPDVGSAIARQWIDRENINAIVDVPNSSVALAVNSIVRNAPNTVFLNSGAGTSELTGKQCSPNTVQWTYDTWSLANGTVSALIKRGNKSWFFVTADYSFGHSLENDATNVLTSNGGKSVGSVRHPVSTADFASYLLQAQNSPAQVIALANASNDTVNSIKQAAEFGIGRGAQKLTALLLMLPDVHSIGLAAAQNLYLTEPFYWDLNDGTRAFSNRFAALMGGRRPSMIQAGVYASLMHYFKAVKATDTTVAADVMRKMKSLPTDDDLFGKGSVREDGRGVHNMYLFQVKTPSESTGPWDYYKLVETIPGSQAFRPVSEGGCPLLGSR